MEYGGGGSVVFLQKYFSKEIPEFVEFFDLKSRDDLKEIKKIQLWTLFLAGDCELKCLIEGRVYDFKICGESDHNKRLEFSTDDINFTPVVLPLEEFPNVHSYWKYVWEYHRKHAKPSNPEIGIGFTLVE